MDEERQSQDSESESFHEEVIRIVAQIDKVLSEHIVATANRITSEQPDKLKGYSDEIKRCSSEWEKAASGFTFWTGRLLAAENLDDKK